MDTLPGMNDIGRTVGSMEQATMKYLASIAPEGGLSAEETLLSVSLLSSAQAIDALVVKGRDISRMISAFNDTFTLLKEQGESPSMSSVSPELTALLSEAAR